MEDAGEILIFTEDVNEEWISWWSGDPENELDTIYPYKIYYFQIQNDCTLHIGCWD